MDDILITDYEPLWPELFAAEATRLRQTLGDSLITRIEHFGSTSVPGLAAKPIIDLLVGVESLAKARRIAVPKLETIGYAFWYDDPDPTRLFFVKGLPPNGPRSHHIHMVERDNPFWERLLFRDYLRDFPEEAARYAALKRTLSLQYADDREGYTDAKGEYVRAVMEKAKALPVVAKAG